MPFLTSLADWCREVTDDVDEHPGWETRGRSGGVDYEQGRPWCVVWHHTASSDQSLEDYHATGSDNAPVCNLDIASDGRVIVIAAGPTNTNGKGRDLRTSKGTVPADSMNSYALGIEFYNNGVGQPWPQIQIDVGFAVIANIQRHLGLTPTDLFTHYQYAPDRKVDPATAAAVQGFWQPNSCTGSGTWNDDDLRTEAVRRWDTPEGDWFDMATEAELRAIVKQEVAWEVGAHDAKEVDRHTVTHANIFGNGEDDILSRLERVEDKLNRALDAIEALP